MVVTRTGARTSFPAVVVPEVPRMSPSPRARASRQPLLRLSVLAAVVLPVLTGAVAVASAQPVAGPVPAAAALPALRDAGTYVVRTRAGALAPVADRVVALGGTVRDRLAPLDTVVAELPAGAAGRCSARPTSWPSSRTPPAT